MLTYDGFTATVWIDWEARVVHGRVVGGPDTATFRGATLEEAWAAFRALVDNAYATQGGRPTA